MYRILKQMDGKGKQKYIYLFYIEGKQIVLTGNNVFQVRCWPIKKKKINKYNFFFFIYTGASYDIVSTTDRDEKKAAPYWCTRARICGASACNAGQTQTAATDGRTHAMGCDYYCDPALWAAVVAVTAGRRRIRSVGRARVRYDKRESTGVSRRRRAVEKDYPPVDCGGGGSRARDFFFLFFFLPLENAPPACVRFHSPCCSIVGTYIRFCLSSAARPSLTLDRSAVCHGRRRRTTICDVKVCHVRPRTRSH